MSEQYEILYQEHPSAEEEEALPFYQKLGYAIEFVREGYEKN